MQYLEGIVAARSRKNGGYCLVVYDLTRRRFFRIVSDMSDRADGELTEDECLLANGEEIALLDVVRVAVKSTEPIGDEFQPENVVFGNERITYIRHTNKHELIDQCGDPNYWPEIFCNRYGSMSIEEAKSCHESFLFARVFGLEFYIGTNSKAEKTCKCRFKYNWIEYKDISVTICKTKEEDIIRYCKNHKRYPAAFVCFSFGHPYEGRCFKYLCAFLGYESY